MYRINEYLKGVVHQQYINIPHEGYANIRCSQEVGFRPEQVQNFPKMIKIQKTPIGINWSQIVLDFYHFGEILDLFRFGVET